VDGITGWHSVELATRKKEDKRGGEWLYKFFEVVWDEVMENPGCVRNCSRECGQHTL
jgi:hypothetical protein